MYTGICTMMWALNVLIRCLWSWPSSSESWGSTGSQKCQEILLSIGWVYTITLYTQLYIYICIIMYLYIIYIYVIMCTCHVSPIKNPPNAKIGRKMVEVSPVPNSVTRSELRHRLRLLPLRHQRPRHLVGLRSSQVQLPGGLLQLVAVGLQVQPQRRRGYLATGQDPGEFTGIQKGMKNVESPIEIWIFMEWFWSFLEQNRVFA